MVTLGNFMEFEHTVPKMDRPSDTSVVMVAGDTLVGTRMANDVCQQLRGSSPRIADIAAAMALQYTTARSQIAEQFFLIPRGLNWSAFYQNHAGFNPNITAMIDKSLADFNLGVELLVAGVDDQGAHIYYVGNPGQLDRQNDVIGYASIGSGGIHAVQSMVGFRHSPTDQLKETVFRVYASKRRAEAGVGVGIETDMAVITPTAVSWLSPESLGQLGEVYARFQGTTNTALRDELDRLDLDGEGEADASAE